MARCQYVRRLPSPAGFRQAIEGPPRPNLTCVEWTLGIFHYSSEMWAVSHPAALVSDTLPVLDNSGRRIGYVWAYSDLPRPEAWTPSIAAFPRRGIDAAQFFGGKAANFSHRAMCASTTYRVSQFRAAFGPGVMDRLPAAGLHCTWSALANATLPAAASKRPVLAEYLADLRGSSNASWCSL